MNKEFLREPGPKSPGNLDRLAVSAPGFQPKPAECALCADKHPEAGCADVGCTHNCEAYIRLRQAAKAAEKPVGADLKDVRIEAEEVAVGAFRVTHEGCGATLLFTRHVHMDTLVRLAAEHDCAKPDPDWNPEA